MKQCWFNVGPTLNQHCFIVLFAGKDLLSRPITISCKIKDCDASVHEKLSLISVRLSLSDTTDMCTDPHCQVSYITITSHWMLNWELHTEVVCTEEFDATTMKTGINIRAAMSTVFSSLRICVEELEKAVYPTDEGANIICALQSEHALTV